MEYRLGNSLKIKNEGETARLVCPECNKEGSFGVFTNADFRLSADFPLFTHKNVYFLICPNCASVYTVEEALGKSFKGGEKLAIGNFDLKKLNEFK